jgi:hypothetical protein
MIELRLRALTGGDRVQHGESRIIAKAAARGHIGDEGGAFGRKI